MYKMTKEELAHSNKRQREVFGWCDEDQEAFENRRKNWELAIVAMVFAAIIVVCLLFPQGF